MLGCTNKKRLKEKLVNDDEDQFIFYNVEKRFQQQVEIQAILNWNNSYKVLVIIDSKSTIDYLCVKIAECLNKFNEFANLEGLKACNLTKKTDKGECKIPDSGEIRENLIDGDILYCDLTTHEYWVKTLIKMNSIFSAMTITLDIKFRAETIFKKLKLLLIKCGLNFWMDYLKERDDKLHYIFSNVVFRITKCKNSFEFNLNDLQAMSMLEYTKVNDLFDFDSAIQCTINLGTLEELIHSDLKSQEFDEVSQNKLRWHEFKDMSFDAFLNDKKFHPEIHFIQKCIRKLIKHPPENMLYIYNKDIDPELKNMIEDEDVLLRMEESHLYVIILPSREATQYFRNQISPDKELQNRPTFQSEINEEENEKEKEKGNDINKEKENISKEDGFYADVYNHSHVIEPKRNYSLNQSWLMYNNELPHESVIEKSKYFSNLYGEEKIKEIESQSPNDDFVLPKQVNKKMNSESMFITTIEHESLQQHNTERVSPPNDKDSEFPVSHSTKNKKLSKHINKLTHQSENLTSLLSMIRDTSKYSNLCDDFANLYKEEKFIKDIQQCYSLLLAKNILEKVTMPAFRNLTIRPETLDTEDKENSQRDDEYDEPIRINNRKILCFILWLSITFIAAILLIFLTN